jgi:hypothetical protein
MASFALQETRGQVFGEGCKEPCIVQNAFRRDLIPPLSLWIEALRRMHHADSALEAARLGEWRCAGWCLPVLRTNWPARCGS